MKKKKKEKRGEKEGEKKDWKEELRHEEERRRLGERCNSCKLQVKEEKRERGESGKRR